MTDDARDVYAARTGERLLEKDISSRHLGIRIEAMGMGWCRLAMPVADFMANGHDIAHGGYIFLLADTAMAYASNGDNRVALAQHAQVTFIKPGQRGETLRAEARELSAGGRNGLYDVEVRGEDGRLIAAFRGATRKIDAMVDPDREPPPD